MNAFARRLALVIVAFASTAALAQPKPALVQDRDSPGRDPFQQLVQVTQNTTNCGPSVTACSVSFATVPAGKRLVVTYASATFHLTGTDPVVSFGLSAVPNFAHLLPMSAPQAGTRRIASAPVHYVVDAGGTPTASVSSLGLLDGATASFAISGYFVSVP